MELREVLSRLKLENGLTTELLSERSGVPKGTLNKLLNGETRNPTGATLKKLADALKCPVGMLYPRAEGEASAALREENKKPVYGGLYENLQDLMPMRGVSLPALTENGQPRAEAAEAVRAPASLPECDFMLRVSSDGMSGARILAGDVVFIRSQDDVRDGEIAAVAVENRVQLRRVYHAGGGLQLLSENAKFPPLLFSRTEAAAVRILGLAVAFESRL